MDQETLLSVKHLGKYPYLRGRMDTILSVAEHYTTDVTELQLIEEVRNLIAESLQAWAVNREKQAPKLIKKNI